jgi:hypothetical protein
MRWMIVAMAVVLSGCNVSIYKGQLVSDVTEKNRTTPVEAEVWIDLGSLDCKDHAQAYTAVVYQFNRSAAFEKCDGGFAQYLVANTTTQLNDVAERAVLTSVHNTNEGVALFVSTNKGLFDTAIELLQGDKEFKATNHNVTMFLDLFNDTSTTVTVQVSGKRIRDNDSDLAIVPANQDVTLDMPPDAVLRVQLSNVDAWAAMQGEMVHILTVLNP